MYEPVLALEWFDSAGTCAVTVNGFDIVHIRIDRESMTADVNVVEWAVEPAVIAAGVTVGLHPDAFKETA